VLTPLVEFRYFVIPWILLSLEINGLKNDSERRIIRENKEYKWLILNILWFIAVNCGVLYVFVKKPFINEYFNNELSRFFW
jgi:hypothetical protein